MKTTQRTGEQGMSLIEMMVVVVIVAMCALWGMHSWHGYRQALKLEQHAQRLRLFLYGVQTEANNYNRSAVLWAMSGCVGTGMRPADCNAAGGKVFTVNDPDIELLDFSDNVTGFYGLRNSAMPGHLTLKNTAGSLRLILSARGRLRLCSENKPLLGIASCQ
ncbi:prepilin-type N-terminal cleavage/methylation domain-containing protein [Rahnella sp. PCH160]|uniref:prepilin-type N-terminal cleavage/methylation domain-containing protein n=1 Tax=Rahnella sp. PCH160 TaxID=3447928 RepID=UPI0039FBB6DF